MVNGLRMKESEREEVQTYGWWRRRSRRRHASRRKEEASSLFLFLSFFPAVPNPQEWVGICTGRKERERKPTGIEEKVEVRATLERLYKITQRAHSAHLPTVLYYGEIVVEVGRWSL